MKLTEYLKKTNTSREDFAREIGVDPLTVYRWETDRRRPFNHFGKIAEVTKGKVTALDFVRDAQ